ncbi:MAG: acyl-CoA dehydrogenase family protein [Thermodesulfobacteriota bacterium]|nr:acyl-CoA dehydrogenase family protein [Thermodesulfobacteriota bacterium]
MKKDINQLFIYPKTWVSKETGDITKSVRQWANKEIVSRRLEFLDDLDTLFPKVRASLALDIGCQGLMFPADLDGLGLEVPDAAPALIMVLKEIGRADAGIGFIHAMEYALCALLTTAGGNAFSQLAPLFCGDTLNSAAMILPACGRTGETMPLFEGRPVAAVVSRNGAGFTISGWGLRPLDLGMDAAVFAVVGADSDGTPGVAVVVADGEGVTRGENILKTGLEGCSNANIDFNSVPLESMMWFEGEAAVRHLYSWTNLLLGAVSVGAAMGCMEVVGEWAADRVIKGGGLMKDNPLCASVLAEAYEEVALSWTLIHHLANALANPGEWGDAGDLMMFTQAQMTGRRVQSSALQAINKMMELMASEGYAREGRMEKAWRDVKTIQSGLCGVGGEALIRLDVARYVFDSNAV